MRLPWWRFCSQPDAVRYAEAITNAAEKSISALNWLEAAIAVDRRGGPIARAAFDAFFERSGIEIVPITAEHATLARQAFREWGRGQAADLNLGDCMAYALSRATGRKLLFKGNDFPQTDVEPALKD